MNHRPFGRAAALSGLGEGAEIGRAERLMIVKLQGRHSNYQIKIGQLETMLAGINKLKAGLPSRRQLSSGWQAAYDAAAAAISDQIAQFKSGQQQYTAEIARLQAGGKVGAEPPFNTLTFPASIQAVMYPGVGSFEALKQAVFNQGGVDAYLQTHAAAPDAAWSSHGTSAATSSGPTQSSYTPPATPASPTVTDGESITKLEEWRQQAKRRAADYRKYAERVAEVREIARSIKERLPSGWEAAYNVAADAFGKASDAANELQLKHDAQLARLRAQLAPTVDLSTLRPESTPGAVLLAATLPGFGPAVDVMVSVWNIEAVRARMLQQSTATQPQQPTATQPQQPTATQPTQTQPQQPTATQPVQQQPTQYQPAPVYVSVPQSSPSTPPAASGTAEPARGPLDNVKAMLSEKPWLWAVPVIGLLWFANRGKSARR
jgi:hypothetical protein